MLHFFMKVTVFMRENTVFRQENTLINESIVTSESSFPLAQQHRLVRHALRGHPTHFVQREAVLRRLEPNPQLEPIFYLGAIGQREASSVCGERVRKNAAYTQA
jgi:hypothetical protein